MSKYRFKTEEEFKRDFLWNKDRPFKWVSVMNKYLGQDISDKYNQACDKQEKFRYDQWHIEPHDYVLKEIQSEYTVGKWYGCTKWDSGDFVKLERVHDEQVYFTECLNSGKYQNKRKNWWSFVLAPLFEADMSIVSSLLPDGHPDKIVSEESPKEIDMKDIQEEAKKRFPIGCKFIPVNGTNTYTLLGDNCTYTNNNNYIWADDMHGSLYDNGKWATLVSLPETTKEMFYAGDYIVTLDVEDGYNCAKKNYCFKQRMNFIGMAPAVDLNGSTSNSHSVMSFDKKSYLKDWRYATPEEAAEYERLGKPYDVTTLQKKEESIPEYVECIKSITNSFTVGKIYDWPYPIDDQKDRRAIPIQGSLFSFKPSTKEAYEAQNASKQLANKDLVKGEIYIYDGSQIGIYPEGPNVDFNGHYIPNPKWLWTLPITHATEEQKAFLRSCIKKHEKVEPMSQLWLEDPIVEQRINTPSIKKETFIDNVQSVDVILRTKKKSIKF